MPLSSEVISGRAVSQISFVRAIREMSLHGFLPGLITLLQYGDASEPPAYRVLDSRVHRLFPTAKGYRIAKRLSLGSEWIFFSKWQLLFAIKLLCTFACRDASRAQVSDDKFLDLLLMTNGFYPRGNPDLHTAKDIGETLQSLALLGYSLIQHEPPGSLIGRYSEIYGRLAGPVNRSEFNSWMDIQEVVRTRLGVRLDSLKAVLFALYSRSIANSSWPEDGESHPRLSGLIPEHYFADTRVSKEEVKRTLELVTISPEQIRDQHLSVYGDQIGNPVDLGILLRHPAITLDDGTLAGISGQLLIQRYTCGLYWDIHDSLPDHADSVPNRQTFQTFFGELHERYSREVLERMKADQMKARRKVRLLSEQDYLSGRGSNPDSLLIESIGRRNTRCVLFEFKVGRPRYKDSIVEGDVQAFQSDVSRKIEEALEQEIDFCRQLQKGQREIPGFLTQEVTGWFFTIVVTDPFPAMGLLLKPLRRKLIDAPDLNDSRRYGPFILSLGELEQLETLPKKRISQLLIDWNDGPDRDWPFNTFFAYRTRGYSTPNLHLETLADEELDRVTRTLLGRQPAPYPSSLPRSF